MAKHALRFDDNPRVAYFSMEMALESGMATYAGGLGVLAGDVMRSAADLGLPMIGVTLVCHSGYFKQVIHSSGQQLELPDVWRADAYAQRLGAKVVLELEGRPVWVGGWLYRVSSHRGSTVPVVLLDTDLPENQADDRKLTNQLYGGDQMYRLKQEAILGIGGVRMLRALSIRVRCYHLNEGHTAFLGLESQRCGESARRVFTTHTPVEAGQDRFPYPLVRRVLNDYYPQKCLRRLAGSEELNMTRLALSMANYVNGVALRHADVSQRLFPDYKVQAVTNGVHPLTWASEPLRRLYNRHCSGWHHQPELLMHAEKIPAEDLWEAHVSAKRALIRLVRESGGPGLDVNVPIVGFARRMTAYKRALLLFHDRERLEGIARVLPFQVVIAGKAHPNDQEGKRIIEQLHQHAASLAGKIPIAFIQNYDMNVALTMVSGSDVWLNTPMPPQEASGTSGMKAAFNGVPNLSILDGWWLEGCIEGITGWAIGTDGEASDDTHAASLYQKLEATVLPLWHRDREGWVQMMKGAIGRNANFFNSHRMMRRYAAEAYLLH